jgi:hypothetical protein
VTKKNRSKQQNPMEGVTMAKTPQDEAMNRMAALAGLDVLQPQQMMAAAEKAATQMQDVSRAWMSVLQRTVDSNLDLCMALGRSSGPSEAMKAYRQWMEERRDAMMTDGRDMAAMMFKLYSLDMMPVSAARDTATEAANVSPMRAAAGD